MGSTLYFFFFQAEDGIRDYKVTGVQTCALPICATSPPKAVPGGRYDTAKWIKQSGKKVSAAFFRSALAVLEHRTFAGAVRRLGDGYGFRRCCELFAEEQRTGCDRVDCSGCADGNDRDSSGGNRAD